MGTSLRERQLWIQKPGAGISKAMVLSCISTCPSLWKKKKQWFREGRCTVWITIGMP